MAGDGGGGQTLRSKPSTCPWGGFWALTQLKTIHLSLGGEGMGVGEGGHRTLNSRLFASLRERGWVPEHLTTELKITRIS